MTAELNYFMGCIVMKTSLSPSIMAPAITARRRQKQKNAKATVPRRPDEGAEYNLLPKLYER